MTQTQSSSSDSSISNESNADPDIEVAHLDFHYGSKQVLFGVNLVIPRRQITAFIGPSGCGKSTLLRCFNRINDRIPSARISKGSVMIKGVDIYRPDIDLAVLRRRVGMVFQKWNPFPKSIFENVVYGLRIQGINDKAVLEQTVEECLRKVSLWDDVKDRLSESALGLSGGQQQRLCIARSVAVKPDIILMDEPCSALDPISTLRIEELMQDLRRDFTIVIVTHNMQQARRCSDHTAFFYLGKLVEFNPTLKLFEDPEQDQTEAYISGKFS